MSDVEQAWVGALIEGEGCVRKHSNKGETFHWRIVVANTSAEILSALVRATGIANIYLTANPGKPCFQWQVYRQADVADLVRQCSPYSEKCQAVIV